MLKMLEVIGTSTQGFSEAVRQAILQLSQEGEKIHFFEVIEQRGAVREGALKEFQVKLKVAVESAAVKDSAGAREKARAFNQHTKVCPTCNEGTEEGHLCVPLSKKEKKCEWCGSLIVNERHLCDGKSKALSYICNSCGRTAVRPEYLCKPKKMD